VSSIRPSSVDLLDPDRAVVASSRGASTRGFPPVGRAAAKARDRRVTVGSNAFRVAARPVAGTPWRLVVAVPEARLYAPLSSAGRWLAWGGLGLFVFASLAVAILIGRLLTTRSLLVEDIAKRQEVERELRDAQTRFGHAFEEAPIGIALVDLDGVWRQVNRALCTMLGYSERELLARTREQLTHPDDLPADLEQVAGLVSGEIDHCTLEKRFIDARGDVVWASVSRSIVRDDGGQPLYFIAQVQDISERRSYEAKLAHLADHDALTGLFNRRRFEHELERQVAYTDRYRTPAALLMLDLDNFKHVNDTLGHAVGDEVLVRVATTLRERLRINDVIARLGGDEFAIILPATETAEAEQLVGALLATIRDDGGVLQERQAIQVSASIGIAALRAGASLTPAELMMRADVAMYDAKENGRGRCSTYDPDAERASRRVVGTAAALEAKN
jgi:diguanylate cyclase (GGDEF)-like protein/PAS domain S-box-containing protein